MLLLFLSLLGRMPSFFLPVINAANKSAAFQQFKSCLASCQLKGMMLFLNIIMVIKRWNKKRRLEERQNVAKT
ncbi:hypothetical protein GCM10027342_07620 [Photobacterium alginatilyticum]